MKLAQFRLSIKLFLFIGGIVFLLCTPIYAYATPALTEKTTLTDAGESGNWGIPTLSGDINGDGFQDMVVGDNSRTVDGHWGSGSVYIFYGGETNNNVADVRIYGDISEAQFPGYSFAAGMKVADVNLDGCDDIIASPLTDTVTGDRSTVYVFYGASDLPDTIQANEADLIFDFNGIAIYTLSNFIGNFNGDSLPDIAIITTNSYSGISETYVYLQTNNGFSTTQADYSFSAPTNTQFGIFSSFSGDVNGDSITDLLVGDHYSSSGHGVYLFTGRQSGFIETPTSRFIPQNTTDTFTREHSPSSGDIDQDGMDDICIGAITYSGVSTNRGRVYCWYGREDFETEYNAGDADIRIDGQASNDNFGRVTHLYDVTNDGRADLLVGAYQNSMPNGSRHGKLFIYKNSNGDFEATPWLSKIKTSGNALFGTYVRGTDWDADGWADVVVTEPAVAPSKVYIYEITHGTPTVTLDTVDSATTDTTITGTASNTTEGFTVNGVEWSTDNEMDGTWGACSSDDGTFDESSEDFSCDISSLEDSSGRTTYVRSHDQDELYIPPQLYGTTGEYALDRVSPTSGLKLNINSEDDKKEPGKLDINVNDREMKLYFSISDQTTDIDKVMISEHQDFRGASWKDYDGDISFKLSSKDGKKHLYIKFKDEAGNETDTYVQLVKLDTVKPNLVLEKVWENTSFFLYEPEKYSTYWTHDQTPSFEGTSEERSEVKMYVDGVKASEFDDIEKDGKWVIADYEFSYGTHEIEFKGEDRAGNDSDPIKFTLAIQEYLPTYTQQPTQEVRGVSSQVTVEKLETKQETPTQENIIEAVTEPKKKNTLNTILKWFGVEM
ncbi:MAG: FG-GAP repeat protein [uncultured bacterium]|nr:MAG: FG-GAP repeat protein [uncultured bacterium]